MADPSNNPRKPPYLRGVVLNDGGDPPQDDCYPFNLRWFSQDFELRLDNCVTFFVGENGSGKSTLLETIAVLSRLPPTGGGRSELGNGYAPPERCELATCLRPWFHRRPKDAYFFRAESQAHFASLLDARKSDPDFIGGDAYQSYGGKSLHSRSHGEAFLELMTNRFHAGLFLMDEPESALSPQRQLSLLALIARLAAEGNSQFIIATHSPILLTYPGATLLSFDEEQICEVQLEDTSHYHITRGILENPKQYWQHLMPDEATKRS